VAQQSGRKFTLANTLKDLTYLESMADAAGLANSVGNAVKNCFTLAVAGGANGPENYVPHLPIHVGHVNGLKLTPE